MREGIILFLCALFVVAFAPGQDNAERPPLSIARAESRPEARGLPVRRVTLYKNGIGFFEHLGRVSGNQDVAITFTSGQLDDVLKSLTILDLGGGRVSSVTYGSEAPLQRRLGELSLPVGEKATIAEFLGALRGARLEVRAGATAMTGRLLSVERKTRATGTTALEVDYLSVMADTGEIRSIEFSPALTVRILDRSLADQVTRYMSILTTARDADLRRMVVSAAGSGDRSLSVSYISEVPVWKTTYRVVLPSKPGESPFLQGWAIVDNTVGEDWEDIELSLVAGAPHSFVQSLSQPYFSRRPVVALPEHVSIAPQTHQSTLFAGDARLTGTVTDPAGAAIVGARVRAFDQSNALVGAASTNSSGVYEIGTLPETTVRIEVESPGFAKATIPGIAASAARVGRVDAKLRAGSVAEAVEVTASVPALQTQASQVATRQTTGTGAGMGGGYGSLRGTVRSPSDAASTGGPPAAQVTSQAAALGEELGDLFQYRLKDPITIRKNQSALVPIVAIPITAEKVSIWNDSFGLQRPLRALSLTNTSSVTLDGGSLSLMEYGAFAGEGIVEAIRPGEKRLVSYATDLAVTAGSRQDVELQRVARVRISRGVMIQERERREKRTYTFRNEDDAPRTIVVEHPARAGYQLRGEVRPVETTAQWLRFRVQVEAKQTATLVVEQARPEQTTYSLSKLDDGQVAVMVADQSLTKPIEAALRQILSQKEVVAGLEDRKEGLEQGLQSIFDDQQRLRENLKSLKGSPEEKALVQRYTSLLNEEEDRLAGGRKEVKTVEEQLERANSDLDRLTSGLVFDVTL